MPDADGRIRGIAVPAEAWERIFGDQGELFERKQPTFDEMIPPLEEPDEAR